MKAIIPNITKNSTRPYYLQLYDYLKQAIMSGEIRVQEKLPSLRSLAKTLRLSVTTIELAYNQLLVEGYIYSKPHSGYYVDKVFSGEASAVSCAQENPVPDADPTPAADPKSDRKTKVEAKSEVREAPASKVEFPFGSTAPLSPKDEPLLFSDNIRPDAPKLCYDTECFDFNKWKKCINHVLTEHTPLLLFEGDPQGEPALRYEIAQYLYRSRGVTCRPDQIVIGAGTQQLTNHLATILNILSIGHIAVEDPGYLPVNNIFRDRGFTMTPVKVGKDGITIERLPANIRSAVYVSPSNQVPTGAVMPIGRRYELLTWAFENDSIIIEDDYDSELRYFGKPIPALQGLDTKQRVIYLGSFSATLFPSIKISYMVLPDPIAAIFQTIRTDYVQTCSKLEQLTLALFMKRGYYQTNIKKLRNLYSQKRTAAIAALTTDFTTPTSTASGINMIITVAGSKSADQLCLEAQRLGIHVVPTMADTDSPSAFTSSLILYYSQIPLSEISEKLNRLVLQWAQADLPVTT